MMPTPTISVVIPTYNEVATIAGAILQFDDLEGSWELIVADSGSTDATREIAVATGRAKVVRGPVGRGAGMNAGARFASGDILLFLHADTRLPHDAHRLIVDAFADPGVAATAFRLRMDREGLRFRLLSPVSQIRVAVQRTFFGDQVIAVRRTDFERVGGYREPLLMEDVDLSKRMRRRGKLKVLPAEVVTSARRFERHGVFRTLVLMTLFQFLYAAGVSADLLAKTYGQVRDQPDEPVRLRGTPSVRSLVFETEDGGEISPVEWRGSTVLLVFLRWLG